MCGLLLTPTRMPNYPVLDQAFRLLPWSLVEHRGYVLGQYGAIKGTMGEEAAAEYLATYRKKEAEADAAYEVQRANLRNSSVATGTAPQELPDLVKIPWDPTIPEVQPPVAPEVVEPVAPVAPEVK